MKNVGGWDAVLRTLLGAALFGVAAAYNARPFLALGAALVGIVFVGTALTRFCPLYAVLGVNTCHHSARTS